MTAPRARRVDMLTGEKAPEKFFAALSEADNHCRELDTLRELQTRNDELTAENADLAERLADLDEAHQLTLTWLAEARSELAAACADRDTFRAALAVPHA